jgi:hypothetical protein
MTIFLGFIFHNLGCVLSGLGLWICSFQFLLWCYRTSLIDAICILSLFLSFFLSWSRRADISLQSLLDCHDDDASLCPV